MKTIAMDPWNSESFPVEENKITEFEDSFVAEEAMIDSTRLSDSEQYLEKLYTRLKNVQGGKSKKDLVDSLSQIKEDSLARFISTGGRLATEEEAALAANPLIRHITPHLQALTSSELVHLLKADVLQVVTDEQNAPTSEESEVSETSH
ncbi:uncharacterized protein [Chelonus insularis]|uniref:uncharacterized protein n=1 Tax=Chelonus insularis TaxID=460826 RepID=UPI00158BF31F|nr:uncharacterized protein LOC118064854 [Chelonus insularis]